VGFSSKQLKEPYTLDGLRDVFMRIRAALDSNRSAWVQYVLPPDDVLPDELAAGSSAADASNPAADMASHDSETLDQLMKETRAVLAR
jgi:peroxin-3